MKSRKMYESQLIFEDAYETLMDGTSTNLYLTGQKVLPLRYKLYWKSTKFLTAHRHLEGYYFLYQFYAIISVIIILC